MLSNCSEHYISYASKYLLDISLPNQTPATSLIREHSDPIIVQYIITRRRKVCYWGSLTGWSHCVKEKEEKHKKCKTRLDLSWLSRISTSPWQRLRRSLIIIWCYSFSFWTLHRPGSSTSAGFRLTSEGLPWITFIWYFCCGSNIFRWNSKTIYKDQA